MKNVPKSSRSRHRLALRLLAPLTLSAAALAAAPTQAAAATTLRDLGVVAPSTTISAIVWLKGSRDAALEAAVAGMSDASDPNYHRWMTDDDLAATLPSPADLAAVQASLASFGLNVGDVLEGGTFIRITGTAAQFKTAFGSPIHSVQTATGRTAFKAATQPVFAGVHAELVGGVAGLSGSSTKPFVAQQLDPASGLPVPAFHPQAGTNPLASFTSDCFGPVQQFSISGFNQKGGGGVGLTFKGPTYLTPTATASTLACGYTAQQLVQHYGLAEAQAVGLTGRGQTIVIVDAYGSPTALADANTFAQAMGLPALNAENFRIVYPDGPPAASDSDWALETMLDIEWAHAFAPEARIVLVVAPTNDDAELAHAVDYAARHRLGNVISNSYGQTEVGNDPSTARMYDAVFRRAAALGVAVNVAAGDAGDNGVGTPLGAASVPSDSPYATSVGGTSINVPSDNGPVDSAWGMSTALFGSSLLPQGNPTIALYLQGGGGGESVFFKKPRYQAHLPGAGRQQPDISALADPQTGAIVFNTDPATGQPAWRPIGGTSLATPMFSAIWALADQAAGESLGQAAPVIARLPTEAIRDVLPIRATRVNTSVAIRLVDTTTNYDAAQLFGVEQTQPSGFVGAVQHSGLPPLDGWRDVAFGMDSSLRAAPGWDNATGYGQPNGLLFIEAARWFARVR